MEQQPNQAPPFTPPTGLRGKTILKLETDEFGNITLYAPNIPPETVIKILAGVCVDLIFSSFTRKTIQEVRLT